MLEPTRWTLSRAMRVRSAAEGGQGARAVFWLVIWEGCLEEEVLELALEGCKTLGMKGKEIPPKRPGNVQEHVNLTLSPGI